MTPTQPSRVTPHPFAPRPPLAGRNRLRPLVAQPIHGLVIAPHVADRARLEDEPTPICASVEQDLRLSFRELTERRLTASRPEVAALEHSSALEESAPTDVADPIITPDPDIEQPDTSGEPDASPEPEPESQESDTDQPLAPVPDTDVATADDVPEDEVHEQHEDHEPPAIA